MKKLMAIVMAALMIMTCMVGCGKEEEKTEPLKIKSQPEDTLLTIGVGGKFKVEGIL